MMRHVPVLVEAALTSAGTVFVESVDPQAGKFRAAGVINLGDRAMSIEQRLKLILREAPTEPVQVAGSQFWAIKIAQGMKLLWGRREGYLYFAVGQETLESLLSRQSGSAPKWLADIAQQLPIARRATVSYVNVPKILQLVSPFAGPQAGKALAAAGITQMGPVISVTGLDEQGFASKSHLGISGTPTGIWEIVGQQGLTTGDLANIPQDSLIAIAAKIQTKKILPTIFKIAAAVEPRAADMIRGELFGLNDMLGVDIENDIIGSLDGAMQVYAPSADGGLLAGWTATLGITNQAKLETALNQLLRMAKQQGAREVLRTQEYRGHTIYTLVVPDEDFLVAPAFCVSQKHLVLGLFPQNIKGYVDHMANKLPGLAAHPQVASRLKGDAAPVALAFQDTKQLFRLFYPLLQYGAKLMASEMREIEFDPSMVPALSVFDRHLQPSVASVGFAKSGYLAHSQQTLPGQSVASSAPVMVALLLPAVQSARQAARRVASLNNMRQFGIAMHVYADSYRALPAAYNTDANGKPLLSWRVHILPFVEQEALYRRFKLDEPWDSPHNKKLIPLMPPMYRSPLSVLPPGKTTYLGAATEKGVFVPPTNRGKTSPLGTKFRDITDGMSNTAMILEVPDKHGVTWTKPDDYRGKVEFRQLANRPSGLSVLFCDGAVQTLSLGVSKRNWQAYLTRNGGEAVRSPSDYNRRYDRPYEKVERAIEEDVPESKEEAKASDEPEPIRRRRR